MLPFHTESFGFEREENEATAANEPRSKSETSDTLGNPGGAIASIYLTESETPAPGEIQYLGVQARTTIEGGVFQHVLPGEHVSLWFYDTAATAWQSIGRGDTDEQGRYAFPSTGFVTPNGEPLYSLLEGDRSCDAHYNLLLPPGSKVIVTDIDGTLTTSDNELLMQIGDGTYVPAMMGAADQLIQAWANKGYPIVYLTARPHLFRAETRGWLQDLGFPAGPVITAVAIGDTAAYKTLWLDRMFDTFGWMPVAAYGNADTDIIAYESSGIPKDRTFIVGPLAGDSGTVAIPDNDFTDHIATFVNAQPDN
jgi:hypothetical protein